MPFAKGQLDEAIAEYRKRHSYEARCRKCLLQSRAVLLVKGKMDDAITACRQAIALKPDDHDAHYNLGIALNSKRRWDEAIAEYRSAIALKPDYAEAHCNLGRLLDRRGRFAEALVELTRGHELGSNSPNWRYTSAQWVRDCQQNVKIDERLSAILRGEDRPRDPADKIVLAAFCYKKSLHEHAARLFEERNRNSPTWVTTHATATAITPPARRPWPQRLRDMRACHATKPAERIGEPRLWNGFALISTPGLTW